MKYAAHLLLFLLIQATSLPAFAAGFCGNARFMPLDELLADKGKNIGLRVKTRAILQTDLKEYSSLRQSEHSVSSILVGDDETAIYRQRHSSNPESLSAYNISADYFSKLHALRIDGNDMSQLVNYRQELLLCGRLIKEGKRYSFAIDDSILEESYLIPTNPRHPRRATGR